MTRSPIMPDHETCNTQSRAAACSPACARVIVGFAHFGLTIGLRSADLPASFNVVSVIFVPLFFIKNARDKGANQKPNDSQHGKERTEQQFAKAIHVDSQCVMC